MNKTVLITGSNSGIGKLTAELFARKGWQVIATMRNTAKAGSLASIKNVHIYELDVTDMGSIQSSQNTILRDFSTIDVVINNAGFGVYGAFELASEEDIDRQWAVNVKGLMMVTKAWLPHFRKNEEGLFINISSVAGIASYPLGSLYISSKWAVEGFSEALYYEVRPFNIRIKLVEPGGFKTNFQTTSITWTADSNIDVYHEKVKATQEWRNARQDKLPDAILVAERIFEAATDPSEKMRYLVGKDAEEMMAFRNEHGAEAYVQKYFNNYHDH
ncbi:MAG: SDR family oxidoreductase [Bacteroidota bacterium]